MRIPGAVVYVNRFEQRSLAWSLVELAEPHLTPEDRTWLWVEIGAGDLESALFALVGRCLRSGAPLPPDVSAVLGDWLRGYAGTDVAAAFGSRIAPTQDAGNRSDPSQPGADAREVRGKFSSRPRRVPVGSPSPGTLHSVGQS